MGRIRSKLLAAAGALLAGLTAAAAAEAARTFRAGADATDVTPADLPVIINGGFLSASAAKVNGRLHVRWLVLDDGQTRVALGVLDTCLIPVEFADEVKARAQKLTGIPAERIMLSATHTHSAPSLMQALGTPPDPHYPDFVLPRIVEGLQRAAGNLAPARAGWAVAQAPEHTHTRIWIRRPDKMQNDPFGALTVRANMHPRHEDPDAIGPSGPSDPALTLLAIQSSDGRPLAVFANYAMHYFGAPPVSADYYGVFAQKVGPLIGAAERVDNPPPTAAAPAFVAIMSQGTGGDQHWMDYAKPRRHIGLEGYVGELARIAADAYNTISFQDQVPLAMREKTLRLATRQPDEKRLAWARGLIEKMGNREPKDRSEVYAREQLWLKENPVREVKLQALRVGELGLAMWPCEVFALSGLKLKAQSPLQPTMNIELANAEEGYIPPPELYPLGGYNTWPCRSAGLEVEAEPKIVDALLGLLEEVSGRERRTIAATHGVYAQAVLAAQPLAYWRMDEWSGTVARDATGAGHDATYEPGVARWLDGPPSPAFSGQGVINRCPHFAGGRMKATLKDLKDVYTVEMWFWSGWPDNGPPVIGTLLGRGTQEYLGLNCPRGTLVFGGRHGNSTIGTRMWHHAVLVRDGQRVRVYLNGAEEPIMGTEAAPDESKDIYIGGRGDKEATFEGKIDEVAIYGRALSADEILQHYKLAGVQP